MTGSGSVDRRLATVAIAAVLTLLVQLVGVAAAAAPQRSAPGGIPRALEDRQDRLSKWQVHVVYFVPQGSPDERLDVDGTLDAAARRMQSWFKKASGGYSWRLDTFGPKGLLDVTFVRGRKTNDQYRSDGDTAFSSVGDELRSRGMEVARTRKRYLVFYGGDTSDDGLCGIATYPIYAPRQYTPARDSAVFTGGDYAFVFLGAAPTCRPTDFGSGDKPGWVQASMMHELTHTEGLAPPGAPHTCDFSLLVSAGHVCGFASASLAAAEATEPIDSQRTDVMFPFINLPLQDKVLDVDNDDYFNTTVATLDLTGSAFVHRPAGKSAPQLVQRVVVPKQVTVHGDLGLIPSP
jgi:hypothetical protein